MTEELRDDHYQQLLNTAYELKVKGGTQFNEEALAIYQDVLKQEFLLVSLT